MSAKIQKWGNSLGVRLPKSVTEKAHLSENSEVEIEHKNGTIIISPLKRQLSLTTLVNQISRDNIHKEDIFLVEGNEVC